MPNSHPESVGDTVLFHIGHYKTGTTWLQEELFLRGNKVFEPVSAKEKGLSTFAELFFTSKEGHFLSFYNFDPAYIAAAYREWRAGSQSGAQIPVVSHERLGGNPSYGGFDALEIAQRIKTVFPNARIFHVIREQRSMYLSTYYNYLAMGGTLSLKRFLKSRYDRKAPGFSPAFFAYLPLIRAYIRLFGRENVLILPYEMFAREPEVFFQRLSAFAGREIHIPAGRYAVRRNERVNRWATYRMRWANLFIHGSSINGYSPLYSRPTNVFFRALKWLVGRVTPEIAEKNLVAHQKKIIEAYIAGRYRVSNREISEIIGLDLSGWGYEF